MADDKREIPNKHSELLRQAVVASAGLSLMPDQAVPDGMAAIALYVPASLLLNKNPLELQADLGLPWFDGTEQGIWFDDLIAESSATK